MEAFVSDNPFLSFVSVEFEDLIWAVTNVERLNIKDTTSKLTKLLVYLSF